MDLLSRAGSYLHGISLMQLPADARESLRALASASTYPPFVLADPAGSIRFSGFSGDFYSPWYFRSFLSSRPKTRAVLFIQIKGKKNYYIFWTIAPEDPDRIPGTGSRNDRRRGTSAHERLYQKLIRSRNFEKRSGIFTTFRNAPAGILISPVTSYHIYRKYCHGDRTPCLLAFLCGLDVCAVHGSMAVGTLPGFGFLKMVYYFWEEKGNPRLNF